MLQIEQLNQYYGESHILRNISLSLAAGSCTCLMGRNGVGKTTLLKTIMGLLPLRSGQISFEGRALAGKDAALRARHGIGYVPQGREIFPQLTVEENLQVGLAALGKPRDAIPPRIYDLFPVLKKMLRRRGGDLSGGQQQQLAIGRALCLDPRLLILDEPTEGIQPNIVQEIGDVITHLNRDEGISVLLVEQKLPFARRVGKQFVVMERGQVMASGPMAELDDTVVKKYMTV